MTYEELRPYLRASYITIRDQKNRQVSEQEAQRRIVEHIQPGEKISGVLFVYIY